MQNARKYVSFGRKSLHLLTTCLSNGIHACMRDIVIMIVPVLNHRYLITPRYLTSRYTSEAAFGNDTIALFVTKTFKHYVIKI